MYLCLSASNVISTKLNKEASRHLENKVKSVEDTITLTDPQKLKLNTTEKSGEILDESPSEIIKIKKLKPPVETNISFNDYKKETIKRSDNNNERKTAKDLKAEENRYGPVLTFTETANSQEKYWRILPHAPHYRGQHEFRSPIPIIESQSFINKPKMSSVQVNYSPSVNPEGRNVDDSRSREYQNYDHHDSRYSDFQKNPGHGHSVHTETTHDYGRFLPVHYKSKIEKDAENLVKEQKSQNSTRTDRPQSNQQEHRQNPRGYSYGHRQPGSTVFFHLGPSAAPKSHKYPSTFQNQRDQRYQYTSEEYPRTEQYPTSPYAFDSRKPILQNTGGDSYNARQPVSSTEAYRPDYSYPAEQYPSRPSLGPPNAPRQYDSSAERYPQSYPGSLQKDTPIYPGTTTHSPRQYSTSSEQFQPHYQNNEKKYLTPYEGDFNSPTDHMNQPQTAYAPKQYGTSAEQLPPNYESDRGKMQSPYTAGLSAPLDHVNVPKKEFQESYYNAPKAPITPAPDSPYFNKHSVSAVSQTHQSPSKHTNEIDQQKTYFNTYMSLLDLYKSFGFQPLNLNEMPAMFPSQFTYGGALSAEMAVTTPLSGSFSTENYDSNTKSPIHAEYSHTNLPVMQNYNGYQTPYAIAPYNNDKSNEYGTAPFKPDFVQTDQHPVPLKSYHEQVPYDSNRSPIVSTEHYDNSDVPQPEAYNTQVESPKETFPQNEPHNKFYPDPTSEEYELPQGKRRKPIRIKDYNVQTFYGDTSQKDAGNSAEISPDLSVSQYPPPPSHPIVRKNPYHLESPHSEELKATNRPRVYPGNSNLENIPPASDSTEVPNNFQLNEKPREYGSPNVIDNYNDVRPIYSSYDDVGDNRQNDYNVPNSHTTPPEAKTYQEWKSRSPNKSALQNNPEHYKTNKIKRPSQSSDKIYPGESYGVQEQRSGRTANGNTRSKRKGKRSSQRGSKKQKTSARSQSETLRASGSTYHWGMERHKDTEGFFQ